MIMKPLHLRSTTQSSLTSVLVWGVNSPQDSGHISHSHSSLHSDLSLIPCSPEVYVVKASSPVHYGKVELSEVGPGVGLVVTEVCP